MKIKTSLLFNVVRAGILSLGLLSAAQAESIDIGPTKMPVDPGVYTVFVASDADNDERISLNEFRELEIAAGHFQNENSFIAMDTDRSRDVTLDEFLTFLPTNDIHLFDEKFINAAGTDGLMTLAEFRAMRAEEQVVNNELVWKFARLDRNHDGFLSLDEFDVPADALPGISHGSLEVEPDTGFVPELPNEDPGRPEIVPDTGFVPELPNEDPNQFVPELPNEDPGRPEIVPDTGFVPELPNEDPNQFVPELPNEDPDQGSNGGTTAPESESVSAEELAQMKEQLSALETKLARVEKSMIRTMEKIDATTSERKAARLERRLKRQQDRFGTLLEKYSELSVQLSQAVGITG